MVFAAVAQYVGEVLQNPDNHVEIGRFVVSKIGPEYEDNYLEIVEAAKNGTALDVADSCLSLVEEFATNIGAQEDVNPVVAFFAKIVSSSLISRRRLLRSSNKPSSVFIFFTS